MSKKQRRWFWSDGKQRLICAQARVAGVSVAQVARRYSMNTHLIHKWLRDPRFGAEEETGGVLDGAEMGFVPVDVEEEPLALRQQMPPPVLDAALSAQRVDITLSGGRRILVEGTTALSSVLSLLEGLMA